MASLQHIIEKNGNLTFIADASNLEDLQDIKDRVGGDDVRFLSEMMDTFGFVGNGQLWSIYPEHIGALTEAPLISDDVEHDDAGDVHVRGRTWAFMNYQLENFAETLLETGRVTFGAVH
ncbi:hypothetical protein AB4Y45_34725 [Paraburkholderia sp. EG287A]|uniref:hypothetical protein n=1 Tax=Paraburkholderia sp. EG287A TaxID=3237012 RepID=UPI0034D1C2D2